MDGSCIGEFIRTVAVICIPIIEYLGLKKFNDSYMKEKGKNLATKEDIQDLTIKARECYNKLVLTCNSKELPKMFLKIIFDDRENKMKLYNKYRNLSRSELGIETELELDEQSVFLSRVSTDELSRK